MTFRLFMAIGLVVSLNLMANWDSVPEKPLPPHAICSGARECLTELQVNSGEGPRGDLP